MLGWYDNVVKGCRRVDALDPNTVEFITMYKEESRRSADLKEKVATAGEGFEADQSDVLGAECSIRNLIFIVGIRWILGCLIELVHNIAGYDRTCQSLVLDGRSSDM